MSEHTPTPWRVEDGTDLIWGACNPDDRSSYGMGYSIVEGKAPGWKPYKPSMEEREANAAFIVKAVNSHDALVEAIKHAKARFECLAEDFQVDKNNVDWAMCSVDAERMTRALDLVGSPSDE